MTEHDRREAYCPMLGHCLPFSYCRQAAGTLPCAKIVECWAARMPIAAYLTAHFSPEELERALAPRPGKVERILRIAEEVEKSLKKTD